MLVTIVCEGTGNRAYLKEALQPPNLETALSDKDGHLEDAPPLDSCVCALRGVSVSSLSNDNVSLLVLDLVQEFGKLLDYASLSVSCFAILSCFYPVILSAHTFFLQRILWCLRLRNVNDAVNIERDLFRVGSPVLVAEAVGVSAVLRSDKGVIARRNGLFVDGVDSSRRFDLR